MLPNLDAKTPLTPVWGERTAVFAGGCFWGVEIVTQAVPLDAYYKAEAYHQDYLAHHPNQPSW